MIIMRVQTISGYNVVEGKKVVKKMVTIEKIREYAHQEMGKKYGGLSGYYIPATETRLSYKGREVLYIRGHAVVESSCCGSGNWDYILVPGYIDNWHCRENDAAQWITEVEPVESSSDQKDLSSLIQTREGIQCITFW